jgi:GAF domain-containing protein
MAISEVDPRSERDSASADSLDPTFADSQWDPLEDFGRGLYAAGRDLQATLDAILLTAADTIDGTDFVGVNVLRGEVFEPQAVLGEAPNVLDSLQQQTGTGPCIDASREQQLIRVDDMAVETRWPRYGELARSLGVGAMLCVPLWVDELRLGSISLYSRTAHAFGLRQERMASLLAVHAAVALAGAQRTENLALALKNRDVIGQAKGILMERHRITADAAFALLSAASQRANRKLSEIASEVADSGALPD